MIQRFFRMTVQATLIPDEGFAAPPMPAATRSGRTCAEDANDVLRAGKEAWRMRAAAKRIAAYAKDLGSTLGTSSLERIFHLLEDVEGARTP